MLPPGICVQVRLEDMVADPLQFGLWCVLWQFIDGFGNRCNSGLLSWLDHPHDGDVERVLCRERLSVGDIL